jgi:hypothetical protein
MTTNYDSLLNSIQMRQAERLRRIGKRLAEIRRTVAISLGTGERSKLHALGGQVYQKVFRLGLNPDGERAPHLERLAQDIFRIGASNTRSVLDPERLADLVDGAASKMLHRQLTYAGLLPEGASYSARLLACLEVLVPGPS